ncbi:AAD14_2 [Sanghuangporus vaninii]
MSSKLWLLPPSAKTALGRYRILSLLAGIRVSPLQLGAMSIGDQWDKLGMDTMDKEASFRLLDAFFDAGGNFIDTANNYQDETSDMFIGEWAEKRGIRDQLVIATKYTTDFKRADQDIKNKVNYVGNNAKSLKLSVEASLKKLRTSYIDILYVHWWDWNTSIKEIMDNLHHLVVRGKVLYLGISDSPAWIVSAAHQYAMDHGKTPFVIYQGAWNVMERSFEREIIPVARSLGLAPAPWNVLAAGRLRSDAEEEKRLASGEKAALEKVAKEVGTEHVTAVAIEYLMQKTPYVFPIIGGRKVEQLMANIDALKISLSDEHIKYIESILPFDLGFPLNFIGDGTSERPTMLYEHAAHWDRWPLKQPIRISPAA